MTRTSLRLTQLVVTGLLATGYIAKSIPRSDWRQAWRECNRLPEHPYDSQKAIRHLQRLPRSLHAMRRSLGSAMRGHTRHPQREKTDKQGQIY